MENLYATVGFVIVIFICLLIIAGVLYLSLQLVGLIVKLMGYWRRLVKAINMIYDEERRINK